MTSIIYLNFAKLIAKIIAYIIILFIIANTIIIIHFKKTIQF